MASQESTPQGHIVARKNLYGVDGTYKGQALPGTTTFHGRGVFLWDDGDAYDGEWQLGRCHGEGVLSGAGGRR